MKKLAVFGSVLWMALSLVACAEGGGALPDNSCPPKAPCGNGQIDPGEACDPGNGAQRINMNLAGATCQTLLNTSGQLTCDCACQFDMAMCSNSAMGGTGG